MARLASVWLAVVALAAGGCRCDEHPQAGPAGETACASACAALMTAECDREGLRPADQPACVKGCVQDSEGARRASCAKQHQSYLACVSTAKVSCAELSGAASASLDHGEGIRGCKRQLDAYRRCVAPCRGEGTAHVGEERVGNGLDAQSVKFEIVRAGCGGCPADLSKGAPPGSACLAYSVCSQVCCGCQDGPARFLVRACVEGECADASRACRVARRLRGHATPCPRAADQ